MIKVIFLDIDGVIINLDSLRNGNRANPQCVTCLNKITDRTKAKIVVSSSWRKQGLKTISNILISWGVTGKVVDTTPILDRQQNDLFIGSSRGVEIQGWLDKNSDTVETFVILDDEADMGELAPFLIQTNYETGLTSEDAERVIAILTK